MITLDAVDRCILTETQKGLPLISEPFRAIADRLGIAEQEVIGRMRRLLKDGAIRRVGAIPNHYALGLVANGMSVWDVADDSVEEAGEAVGALDFVTHCYQRPRHLPLWPYNFFAMVHGRASEEVREKVAIIQEMIGPTARSHDILFSTRILKKTGLRIEA